MEVIDNIPKVVKIIEEQMHWKFEDGSPVDNDP